MDVGGTGVLISPYPTYFLIEGNLKEKRCGKFNMGVLFLHDNASAHRALATQKKVVYLGFQCLVSFLVGLREKLSEVK
jgi:hypothetical protein